jgi:hypothetical protein
VFAATQLSAAVVSGTSWDPPISPTQPDTLQYQLDQRTAGGPAPDVNRNQILSDQIWSIQPTRSNQRRESSIATIVVEVAGYQNLNEFGIYRIGNPSDRLLVFNGPSDAGDNRTITVSGSTIRVGGSSMSGFTDGQFGFYLRSGSGAVFYSQPALNVSADGPGLSDHDHVATYQGADGQRIWVGALPRSSDLTDSRYRDWESSDYVLAWEDLPLSNSDGDYQDFVVLLRSGNYSILSPVPEASTYITGAGALLILGLSAWNVRSRGRNTQRAD